MDPYTKYIYLHVTYILIYTKYINKEIRQGLVL